MSDSDQSPQGKKGRIGLWDLSPDAKRRSGNSCPTAPSAQAHGTREWRVVAVLLDDEQPLTAQGKWATLLVFPLHALWRSCGFLCTS